MPNPQRQSRSNSTISKQVEFHNRNHMDAYRYNISTLMEPIICPYCNNPAKWVESKEIYGKNYGKSYMIWLCKPCDAYVGCHANTKKSKGTLANKELREWRIKAHEAFDPIWKRDEGGKYRRFKAYRWLARELKQVAVHIGESDIKTCKKIIEIVKKSQI